MTPQSTMDVGFTPLYESPAGLIARMPATLGHGTLVHEIALRNEAA
jgi:hypothetical protein